MPRRSWTARAPWIYEALMTPIEAIGMRRLRAELWRGVPRGGRGLEIGAGAGAAASHRAERPDLLVTDISPAMLARARAESATAALVAADVQMLPLPDAAFDWAVGSLLFCEVPEPVRGLREVRRVLRPGATLHLLEHVLPRGALGSRAARALTRVTGPLFGEHFDRVTHESVAAAGFTIERADWRLRGALVHLVARRTDNEEADR